nr:HlyD family type I secretion periplasmic adaptor subunit [uncultured Shinella sp.]
MIWQPLSIGLLAAMALVGVILGWGTSFSIAGAVIAKGQIQAATTRTAVEHPSGGVVAKVYHHNGDKVVAGEILVKLDEDPLKSDLSVIEGELFEIFANEARLEALIAGAKTLSPDPLLIKASSTIPYYHRLIERQQLQLDVYHASIETEKRLMHEQVAQIREQIAGEEAVLLSRRGKLDVFNEQLAIAERLFSRKIGLVADFNAARNDVINTKGEIGISVAKIAELKGEIAELEVQSNAKLQSDSKTNSDKLNELGQARIRLMESRRAILQKLTTLEIRAPIGGIVHDLKVEGLRSVAQPGQALMFIVPDVLPQTVTVRVDAADIDQVHIGQDAALRFVAFHRRTTPIIFGKVFQISADAFIDERSQGLYYFAEIALSETEIGRLGENTLVSGMPVEAFITTDSRSPVSYVMKPLTDYFSRAFRDS